MAGDWIKMRGNLWDDPRVARICDMTDSGEAAVIGALYWLWSTADQHTEDGCMPGLTLRQIDRKTGLQGFGAALVAVGWLADDPQGVVIQHFEEHNGTSAKRRATDAQRKANGRAVSASDADNTRTEGGQKAPNLGAREEKRREENNSSVPDGTGAAAPPPSDRDVVFANGVVLLTAAGVKESNARSFLAGQCKEHGEAAVRAALERCASEAPIQPIPWLQAALKSKPARAGPGSKSDALMARNLAVLQRFAEPTQ